MSVVLQVHEVEKITIERRYHAVSDDCFEFTVIRVHTTLRDGSDGPSVDLFMSRPELCVRTSGESVIERSIEVVRPEEIGNSFDRGHGEGPGQ